MAGDGPFCLLGRPPAPWLVCFVPAKEYQWWHKFLPSRFKHCFALRREGDGRWTLFEPWWSRILVATINSEEAERFLEWGREGIILVVNEHIPGTSKQWRGWMSCAALVAHLLGRDYFVYTPAGLLTHLMAERDTQIYRG